MTAKVLDTQLHSILLNEAIEQDRQRLREDLMGLFSDVSGVLRTENENHVTLIYDYAQLLQRESQQYSPQIAYEAGAVLATNAKGSDQDPESAFMRYICRVNLDPEAQALQSEIQQKYNELHTLLGEASGLIDEFTELYRTCNCSIVNHIKHFFALGYDYMSEATT